MSAQSVFAGKGLFTTSDASSASGLHSDWVAVQKDPEGDPAPTYNNNPGRLCWWQARPTLDIVALANERQIPYIAQAENQPELNRALAVGPLLKVPKALVGNAGSWTDEGRDEALEQGWDYISEFYWNAHPWEAPDGHNYPRFVSVCFGIYSEGDPGGDGYVPQSKSLVDYRGVWRGSFSVWKAEAMTTADRAAYDR